MKAVSSLKIDKSIVSVSRLTDIPDDKTYWLSKTPYERMQAVDTLRRLNYGERQSTARLQRVFEITQRASR
jgi:hypothetical protein